MPICRASAEAAQAQAAPHAGGGSHAPGSTERRLQQLEGGVERIEQMQREMLQGILAMQEALQQRSAGGASQE